MKKEFSYHFMVLKLKNPSEDAKGTPLSAYHEQVLEAESEFNRSFKGIKALIVLEVSEGTITVLLVFFHALTSKVSAKELTAFSRYLYHDKSWGRFSKEEGKLFILAQPVKEFEFRDADLALSEYEVDRERYSFFPEYDPKSDDEDVSTDQEEDEEDNHEEFADEKMVPVLEYILATQNMGTLRTQGEKRKAILQIKAILNPFIYS